MTTTAQPLEAELGTMLVSPNNDRERALEFALRYHVKTDEDDPKNVVETAGTFLAFLQQGNA